MQAWTPYILTGTVSFVVGVAVGLFTDFIKGRINRLRTFRDSMRHRLNEMEFISDEKLIAFHHESIPEFKNECASIQEDIFRWKRRGFYNALTGYCALRDEEISNYNPKAVVSTIFGGEDGHTKTRRGLSNYRLGKRRMCGFLRELIKCAK